MLADQVADAPRSVTGRVDDPCLPLSEGDHVTVRDLVVDGDWIVVTRMSVNRDTERFLQSRQSLDVILVPVRLHDADDFSSVRTGEDTVGLETTVHDEGRVRVGAHEHVEVVLHRADFDLANDEVVARVVMRHDPPTPNSRAWPRPGKSRARPHPRRCASPP